MAISNYSTLKAAIADWLHRTDLTSVIPDFVALAEADIRLDVRCRAMEQTLTGSLSASAVDLPDDFAEVRRVILGEYLQQFVTPDAFKLLGTAQNQRYTVLNDQIVFQQSTGDYSIDYYGWFDALADDGDTNWLLTTHPGIYLWGSLSKAAIYLRGDPSPYVAQYQLEVQRLRRTEQTARFAGRLQIRHGVTVNGYVP